MLVNPDTLNITAAGKEGQPVGKRLSMRMRESWHTKRFWFNYAARKSFDVDLVYWAALHEGTVSEPLDDGLREEMDVLTEKKMAQLQAYREERTTRFPKPDDECC